MRSDGELKIGDLARRTTTKVETVRYYERIGLLAVPKRSEGNYRRYGEKDVARLGFIRSARDLGFSIEQIRELLKLADDRKRRCDQVDEIARAHLVDVEEKIASLSAMRRELRDMLSQCRRGSVDECRIIETLSP